MKNLLNRPVFWAFSLLLLTTTAYTQQINLPRESPRAGVSYQIGLTDITITYSSPAVKGHEIWGGLVPYEQVWRAGANEATTIEFSTDVNMEGTNLPAGKYAFFLIPREGDQAWTAIFNKQADQWSAFSYDINHDAIRVEVKPTFNNGVQERLMYSIHDHDSDKGYIKFAWDDVRLYLRFKVDVLAAAMENILTAIEEAPEDKKWIMYAQGANFLLEVDQNIRQALQWADMSTSRRNSAWNWWIKAQLQAKSGDLTTAVNSAQKAIDLGEAAGTDGFYNRSKPDIIAKLESWKRELGIETPVPTPIPVVDDEH
ncbi:MAG TPA: DUF2911 domain-containing protein [Saprospiraceae bacterium]|nr:DUF2911 domain-containing protein [Saprospiraceae bacterium]